MEAPPEAFHATRKAETMKTWTDYPHPVAAVLAVLLTLTAFAGCQGDRRTNAVDSEPSPTATTDGVTAYAPTEPTGAPAVNCEACDELRREWETCCTPSRAWMILGPDHAQSLEDYDRLAERWRNEATVHGQNSEEALLAREWLVLAYEKARGRALPATVAKLEGLLK